MSAPLAGGHKEQDASHPEHFDRALKAVKDQLNKDGASGDYHLVPLKVLKASSQVVAGAKYNYDVLVGESKTKRSEVKGADLTADHCHHREGGQRGIYKVEVWEKPWENFAEYSVNKHRDVSADETF